MKYLENIDEIYIYMKMTGNPCHNVNVFRYKKDL